MQTFLDLTWCRCPEINSTNVLTKLLPVKDEAQRSSMVIVAGEAGLAVAQWTSVAGFFGTGWKLTAKSMAVVGSCGPRALRSKMCSRPRFRIGWAANSQRQAFFQAQACQYKAFGAPLPNLSSHMY